ncbi:hypothetical protein G3T14_04405 [Methylobacterium sp. BTF04]|uniref:hypothetical protein n=1 Tax=Methylobacterium sp. BTF04 TaxID=2708300 RepID=UPI0013D383F6|nr:hypothetical protein [Methylobacterium sp. BTF04]NEU11367.1 hypothetical protein [Methylobacterium sp. BTF04]
MRRPIAIGVLLAFAVSACDKAEESGETARAPEEQIIVATKSDADVPAWLSPTDPMDPARWLASRELGRPAPEVGSQAEHLRHSLSRAKDTFIEDPRMVANRTVQLGQMLAEAGKPEPYADLLDGLEEVAAATTRKQLFGEMCQHYYNTRQQGADRATALTRLTERYASQGGGDGPRDAGGAPPDPGEGR